MIKEPKSLRASYQPIFVLSLISKSSPLSLRFRMVTWFLSDCGLELVALGRLPISRIDDSTHDLVQCSILSALSLSNGTSLTLVSPSVHEDVVPKVLQSDLPRCETFSKLKRLHLGEWFLTGGCYPLIYLLRHSPGVEKVVSQLDTSGADDYDRFPNAIAEICAPCKEAAMTFGCEKLKKIRIYCHLQRDKRAQIIMLILSTHISPLPSIKIKPLPV